MQVMSRKAFQQLMADFRRVGSQVVFANANRLLLQTTKAEVGNAYAYSQYVIKSIQSKPLFHLIDPRDQGVLGDYLVWYDEFNYGGKGLPRGGGGGPAEARDGHELADAHLPADAPAARLLRVGGRVRRAHARRQAAGRRRRLPGPDGHAASDAAGRCPRAATTGQQQTILGKAFEKPLKEGGGGADGGAEARDASTPSWRPTTTSRRCRGRTSPAWPTRTTRCWSWSRR